MRFLFLALLLATAPGKGADADSVQIAPDFHTPASPLQATLGDYMLRSGGPQGGYLTVSLDPRGPQLLPPPNRFNAMLQGAGAATSMAMFLGAVGTTLGWFSEETSWAITGAMAAAGAIYAGTKYQPDPTLKFNWSADSVIPVSPSR